MSPGTALSSFPERGTHLLHLSLPCRDLLRDASVGRYGQGSRASVTEDRKLRHHLSNHRLSVFLVTQAVNMFWAGESVPKSKPSLGNTTSALLGQGQVTMQTGIVKALRRPVGNKLVSLKSIIPKLVDHTFFFFLVEHVLMCYFLYLLEPLLTQPLSSRGKASRRALTLTAPSRRLVPAAEALPLHCSSVSTKQEHLPPGLCEKCRISGPTADADWNLHGNKIPS